MLILAHSSMSSFTVDKLIYLFIRNYEISCFRHRSYFFSYVSLFRSWTALMIVVLFGPFKPEEKFLERALFFASLAYISILSIKLNLDEFLKALVVLVHLNDRAGSELRDLTVCTVGEGISLFFLIDAGRRSQVKIDHKGPHIA